VNAEFVPRLRTARLLLRGWQESDLEVDKVAPAAVAAAALDAVEAGEPEAVVDDFSRQVKAGLSDDQRSLYPQIEQDFAALAGSAG
jgi:hypothetical protein